MRCSSITLLATLSVCLLASCVIASGETHHPHSHTSKHHQHQHGDSHATLQTPKRDDALSWYRQDLGNSMSRTGPKWQISNANGSISSIPSTVPGGVYLDLMNAGILQGDPYYRDNEALWQWVAYTDWTYSATFDADESILQYPSILLQCDGIDTVATITLNGHFVANVNNMHLRWNFEVKPYLQATGNVLTVVIYSPVNQGLQASEAYPYEVPSNDGPRFLPYRNFVRKAQSDSGWDWGPGFGPSGIWQPIALYGSASSRIMNMVIQQFHASQMEAKHVKDLGLTDGDVLLKVTTYFHLVSGAPGAQVCASFRMGTPNCTAQNQGPADLLNEVGTDVWLTVPSSEVELWWPNGYGGQSVAPVMVNYTSNDNQYFDSLTKIIGLKTVEVVRETGPEGQNGTSFYYVVNGVPIFVKGANMIPAHAFHPMVTDFNLTLSLLSLVETGGNLVRVWGGGIYQRDVLYDYADMYGLLVWQEFGFACAMYPRDDAFLALVRTEVAYQIRRLSSHASLLIFGGNNENEAALTWFDLTRDHRDIYLVDYVKLYIDTVRDQLLKEIGTSTPFVTSSPTRGPQSEVPYTQLWGSAQSPDYGDMHYYNYDANCADVYTLPRARFISEFGFQSLPSLYTWSSVTEQSDWVWNGTMMEFRQRHPDGNKELMAQMVMHFNAPNSTDPIQQFDDWIYLTQAVQSLCYRTAFQHWRRIKQETPGRTMGIVYWQLNDIWQGPTWSSLEYGGRWKMLHYAVKRAYQHVIASGYYDPTTDLLHMYLTSDSTEGIDGNYTYSVYSWTEGKLMDFSQTFSFAALQSSVISVTAATPLFQQAGCPGFSQCYFMLSATYGSASTVQPAEVFPTPIKDVQLLPASLSFSDFAPGPNEKNEGNDAAYLSISFVLTIDNASPYVYVETPLFGRFDDNGFVMAKGESRTLVFTSFDANRFTFTQLESNLKARTIFATYAATASSAILDAESSSSAEQ